jgi:2-dehydro-3-deoxyphosphogluconate aldolase/(4S)-4-hydroxy-2-oxoglutarate aldolase
MCGPRRRPHLIENRLLIVFPVPSDDVNIDLFEALQRSPAVGILRGCPLRHIEAIAGAAIAGGFTVLEVTLDSPEPYRSIERIADSATTVLVGAGTVRTTTDVEKAVDSGAAFLVSPLVEPSVIAEAVRRNVPIFPGAATPTEISHAVRSGAAAVKVFPASHLGGPGYIRAISGPLGHPRLVPTGGVTIENASPFLSAGAFAVGVGGSVFSREDLESGDAERVRAAAFSLIEAIT